MLKCKRKGIPWKARFNHSLDHHVSSSDANFSYPPAEKPAAYEAGGDCLHMWTNVVVFTDPFVVIKNLIKIHLQITEVVWLKARYKVLIYLLLKRKTHKIWIKFRPIWGERPIWTLYLSVSFLEKKGVSENALLFYPLQTFKILILMSLLKSLIWWMSLLLDSAIPL